MRRIWVDLWIISKLNWDYKKGLWGNDFWVWIEDEIYVGWVKSNASFQDLNNRINL